MSRFGGSKYHSRKVTLDGITFDSKLESERWLFLRDLESRGVVSDLRRQVCIELIPRQTEYVVKHLKTKDKVVEVFKEHPVTYIADFVYTKEGVEVIEDTKGFKTPDYIIKRKLARYNGHPITEVKKSTQPV